MKKMSDLPNNYEDNLRKLNILYQISRSLSSTLDLSQTLRIILTGVTFGDGFGFNRAFLFLADRTGKYIEGKMAVGPDSEEEAGEIWQEIQEKNYSLEDFLDSDMIKNSQSNSRLDSEIKKIKVSFDSGGAVARTFLECRPVNIDLTQIPDGDKIDIEKDVLNFIGYPKFCMIPLVSTSRPKRALFFNNKFNQHENVVDFKFPDIKYPKGVLIVDNKFNQRDITENDIKFLYMLGQQAALEIENVHIYGDLKMTIKSLQKVNRQINYLKEYNESVVENIPVSVCVIDKNYTVTGANKSFCEIVNLPKNSVLGENIMKLGLNVRGYNIRKIIKKVLRRKQGKSLIEVNCSLKSGKKDLICNLQLAVFKNFKGEVEGVIIVIDDITDTVTLEKSLEETRNLARLGELAANVAHEIRNPLVSLGGYARRLQKKSKDCKDIDQKSLSIIIEEVERLEGIIYETLEFATRKKIPFKKIDLNQILEPCMDLVKALAARKDVEITLNYLVDEKDKSIIINCSKDHLKQVFINLAKNAVEASNYGGVVRIDVEKSMEKLGKWAVVKINNKGSIIEEEIIDKIFSPFYSTKKNGAGLGLTVTKKIIEEHGGEIKVDSNKVSGTTFTIKLPLSL